MKKLLIVLLALTVIGAFAFAQDAAAPAGPKISIEVNDGLIYSTNSAGSAFKDYGIDYGSGFAGGTVVLTIAETGSNFGYSIAPAYKGTNAMAALDHAWAYVTPIDGLSAYAGVSGNNAPFGDLDNNGAGNYSTSSIGAFYTIGGFSIGAQVSQLAVALDKLGFSLSYTTVPVWIGVHYTMADVFQFNAYGQILNDTSYSFDQARVSAKLVAVPNLTATVGFNGSALANSATKNAFTDVQVGYAIGSLGIGAIVYNKNELQGTNFTTYLGSLSYTLSPQFGVSAYFAGTTASTADYQPEVQLAWTPVAGTTIKFTGFYDTAVEGNGNLGGTYTAPATNGTGGTTSFAVDVKFAY